MKRPYLVHFMSIFTEDFISLKASVGLKTPVSPMAESDLIKFTPQFPIQNYNLLGLHKFQLKFVGMNSENESLYQKILESDPYGNFFFKIPLTEATNQIKVWHIYEVSFIPGIELHLGSYLPLNVCGVKSYAICDFDKTLLDTRYSTTKDVYRSLTSPLDQFKEVPESIDLLNNFINKNYHPFILSASPHFYEDNIRDWLYRRGIFTAGIFLKDYRRVFNLLEGELTPKDIKMQGLYKLGHLIDIVLMAGIPNNLALIGDNYESDPLIYVLFSKILKGRKDPRHVWKTIKKYSIFKTSSLQNAKLLNKIYQLGNLKQKFSHNGEDEYTLNIQIYIRKKYKDDVISLPEDLKAELNTIKAYETINHLINKVGPNKTKTPILK